MVNNIEKDLADKVLFSINNDDQKDVERNFVMYRKHLDLIGKKADKKLMEKVVDSYCSYNLYKDNNLNGENKK